MSRKRDLTPEQAREAVKAAERDRKHREAVLTTGLKEALRDGTFRVGGSEDGRQ